MKNPLAWVRRGLVPLVVLIGLSLGAVPGASAAGPAAANPRVLPPNASAYGATYGEWSARWWQWAYKLPAGAEGAQTHPLYADGDVDCRYGQEGKVWFLGGTYVAAPDPEVGYLGHATRSCTIPSGTPLFFPILNAEADRITAEGGVDTSLSEEELWAMVKANVDGVTALDATVDGKRITNLWAYRAQSPVFAFTMPADNLYTSWGYPVPAGTYTPAVADGYFLMLAPLPVGEHTIWFGGDAPGFRLDVTYNISVAPGR